jgi:hypothetical protein
MRRHSFCKKQIYREVGLAVVVMRIQKKGRVVVATAKGHDHHDSKASMKYARTIVSSNF